MKHAPGCLPVPAPSYAVGGECGFIETGFAIIVNDAIVDALRANVAMLRQLGVDTNIISPKDLHRLDPHLSLEGVAMAAYEPHSGYADPIATTHSLAAATRRAGARFHLNTPITSIHTRAARAIGVMDAAGRFHEGADAVCLVTGPWTGPLLAPLGVHIPITPERAQIAFFRRAPSLRHLVYIDTISGSYFRPHGADLTLAALASFPVCAACFSQIQEREARRARAPTPHGNRSDTPPGSVTTADDPSPLSAVSMIAKSACPACAGDA